MSKLNRPTVALAAAAALSETAYNPNAPIRQVVIDPTAFRWRSGSRHDYGSVAAENALRLADAKRERKKAARRAVLANNRMPLPPSAKPSGEGSNVVVKMRDYHLAYAAHRANLDFDIRQKALRAQAEKRRFEQLMEEHKHEEHDDHEHVHGADCGCEHHDIDHETEAPVSPEVTVAEVDHSDKAVPHPADCGCGNHGLSANTDWAPAGLVTGFYAAGSDASGNRLNAPVLVVATDYQHPTFAPEAATALAGSTPIPSASIEPASDGKRLATAAWLVTWLLANGRSPELKTNEALKQLKSDTHALRRGMGVKKDAVPNAEVLALMKEVGVVAASAGA